MEAKNTALFDVLETAYNDPAVKAIPEFAELILTVANQSETADEDRESYQHAVAKLSHAIGHYYIATHALPESMGKLYQQIKADVPEAKLDEADLRSRALAAGLVALPIMFGGK